MERVVEFELNVFKNVSYRKNGTKKTALKDQCNLQAHGKSTTQILRKKM